MFRAFNQTILALFRSGVEHTLEVHDILLRISRNRLVRIFIFSATYLKNAEKRQNNIHGTNAAAQRRQRGFYFYLGFENTISLDNYFRDYTVKGEETKRKNEKKTNE